MNASKLWPMEISGTKPGDKIRAHLCNCIGCCRVCGECRTAPWHAPTCEKVAALKRKIAAVIAEAQGRVSDDS